MEDTKEVPELVVETEYIRQNSLSSDKGDAIVQYIAKNSEEINVNVRSDTSAQAVVFKNSHSTGVLSDVVGETNIKRNDSYSKFGLLETVSLDVAEQELQNSQPAVSDTAVLEYTKLKETHQQEEKLMDTKVSDNSEAVKVVSEESSEISLSRYFGSDQSAKAVPVSSTVQFFDVIVNASEPSNNDLKQDMNLKNLVNEPPAEKDKNVRVPETNEVKDHPPFLKFFAEDRSGSDKSGKEFFDKIATEAKGNTLTEISSKLTSNNTCNIVFNEMSTTEPCQLHNVPFLIPPSTQTNEEMCEAWIPSENTRRILVALVTSIPGTFFPEKDKLTTPSIIIDEDLEDPVKLLLQEVNSSMAQQRRVLTADDVAQNEEGLKKLIDAECYHAALNLTGRLLNILKKQSLENSLVKHTPYSLKLWFIRIALFVKLKKFSYAEVESEAFGDFDKPDLYYEFYPDLYHGKKGSMVPFSFRVLLAELPQYQGNHQTALNNLYNILHVIQKIISNLQTGCAEDGSMVELSNSRRNASIKLWQQRELKILYSVLNCFLSQKDYSMSVSIAHILLEKDRQHIMQLYSSLGRIYLQLGDMKQAQRYFDLAADEAKGCKDKNTEVEKLINKALLSITRNENEEAYKIYEQALTLQPDNPMLVNNMAVCLLYMGRLKESLILLEQTIQKNPRSCLHDGILFNICTLYELESSHCTVKKHAMLNLVSKYVGDNFMVSCLKIPPNSKV